MTLVHQRKDINDFESQKCSTYLSCGEREKREREKIIKRERKRESVTCVNLSVRSLKKKS